MQLRKQLVLWTNLYHGNVFPLKIKKPFPKATLLCCWLCALKLTAQLCTLLPNADYHLNYVSRQNIFTKSCSWVHYSEPISKLPEPLLTHCEFCDGKLWVVGEVKFGGSSLNAVVLGAVRSHRWLYWMPKWNAALSVPSYSMPIVDKGYLPFVDVHCREKCTSYLLVKMRWQ